MSIDLQAAMALVIEMANEHIADIESGIEEGIYDANDNPDLENKNAALAKVEFLFSEGGIANLPVPQGLTISDCISVLAAPKDDPYVRKAQNDASGVDVSVDETTVTSVGDDGAWVLAWLWVSNTDAGVITNSEVLEAVLDSARTALHEKGGSRIEHVYADWLWDLLTNHADKLDSIADEKVDRLPGPINWRYTDNAVESFMPSDAINSLRLKARIGGLSDEMADLAESFSLNHGNKLDAVLTVYQIGDA